MVSIAYYESIIEEFTPKIKKSLNNTPYQEQEDLEQEIKMKIYEKISVIEQLSAPGFFEFMDKNE